MEGTIISQVLTELVPPFLLSILTEPVTSKAVLMILVGASFGREFGKNLDQGIQAGDWFKKLSPVYQKFVKKILDFTHHWWIGWGLMAYSPAESNQWYFGLGLLIDDLPDIPFRYGLMERKPDPSF